MSYGSRRRRATFSHLFASSGSLRAKKSHNCENSGLVHFNSTQVDVTIKTNDGSRFLLFPKSQKAGLLSSCGSKMLRLSCAKSTSFVTKILWVQIPLSSWRLFLLLFISFVSSKENFSTDLLHDGILGLWLAENGHVTFI